MEVVNRVALVVRPKRRFLEWTQRSIGPRVTEEMLPSFETIYLVEAEVELPDLQDLIDAYAEELFEHQLLQWSQDEPLWPPNRSPHVFRDWFETRMIDLVCDADSHLPWSELDADAEDDDADEEPESPLHTCAWCNSPIEGEVIAVNGRHGHWEALERLAGGPFEVPLADRHVTGVVSAPGSEARRSGVDFMFCFCSEACAGSFKAAWDSERGALLS